MTRRSPAALASACLAVVLGVSVAADQAPPGRDADSPRRPPSAGRLVGPREAFTPPSVRARNRAAASARRGAAANVIAPSTRTLTLRFICFAMQPLPDVEVQPGSISPVVEHLCVGLNMALDSTPQDFLDALRKLDPRHAFHPLLAGTAAFRANEPCVVAATSPPGAECPVTVEYRGTVAAKTATTVSVTHSGEVTFSVPDPDSLGGTERGVLKTGWDSTAPDVVLGRTYCQGVPEHSGVALVFAWCLLEGDVDGSLVPAQARRPSRR